jgi:hypothetical protein
MDPASHSCMHAYIHTYIHILCYEERSSSPSSAALGVSIDYFILFSHYSTLSLMLAFAREGSTDGRAASRSASHCEGTNFGNALPPSLRLCMQVSFLYPSIRLDAQGILGEGNRVIFF